jgi:hypothetical protein
MDVVFYFGLSLFFKSFIMVTILKTCHECGEKIRGRSDKKFCSPDCRTCFHNRHRGLESQVMRAINRVLLRNRKILMECAGGNNSSRIPVIILQSRGFDFSFYTHCRPDRRGKDVIYCYDYGYQRLDQHKVQICMLRS